MALVLEPVALMVTFMLMTQPPQSLLHPCQGSSSADRAGTGCLFLRLSSAL